MSRLTTITNLRRISNSVPSPTHQESNYTSFGNHHDFVSKYSNISPIPPKNNLKQFLKPLRTEHTNKEERVNSHQNNISSHLNRQKPLTPLNIASSPSIEEQHTPSRNTPSPYELKPTFKNIDFDNNQLERITESPLLDEIQRENTSSPTPSNHSQQENLKYKRNTESSTSIYDVPRKYKDRIETSPYRTDDSEILSKKENVHNRKSKQNEEQSNELENINALDTKEKVNKLNNNDKNNLLNNYKSNIKRSSLSPIPGNKAELKNGGQEISEKNIYTDKDLKEKRKRKSKPLEKIKNKSTDNMNLPQELISSNHEDITNSTNIYNQNHVNNDSQVKNSVKKENLKQKSSSNPKLKPSSNTNNLKISNHTHTPIINENNIENNIENKIDNKIENSNNSENETPIRSRKRKSFLIQRNKKNEIIKSIPDIEKNLSPLPNVVSEKAMNLLGDNLSSSSPSLNINTKRRSSVKLTPLERDSTTINITNEQSKFVENKIQKQKESKSVFNEQQSPLIRSSTSLSARKPPLLPSISKTNIEEVVHPALRSITDSFNEDQSSRRSSSSLASFGGRRTLDSIDNFSLSQKPLTTQIFQISISRLLQLYKDLHIVDTEHSITFRQQYCQTSSKNSIDIISQEIETLQKLKVVIFDLEQMIHTRELQVEILHRLVRSYALNQYKEYSMQTMQRRVRQICIRLSHSGRKIRNQYKLLNSFVHLIPQYLWNNEIDYLEKMKTDLEFFRQSPLNQVVARTPSIDPSNLDYRKKKNRYRNAWTSPSHNNQNKQNNSDSEINTSKEMEDEDEILQGSPQSDDDNFEPIELIDSGEQIHQQITEEPIKGELINSPNLNTSKLDINRDLLFRLSQDSEIANEEREEAKEKLLKLLESLENSNIETEIDETKMNLNLESKQENTEIFNSNVSISLDSQQNTNEISNFDSKQIIDENLNPIVTISKELSNSEYSEPQIEKSSIINQSPNQKREFIQMIKKYYNQYKRKELKRRLSTESEISPSRIKKQLHDGRTGITLSYFTYDQEGYDSDEENIPLTSSELIVWWNSVFNTIQTKFIPLYRGYLIRKKLSNENKSALIIQQFWRAYQSKILVYRQYLHPNNPEGKKLLKIRCHLSSIKRNGNVKKQRYIILQLFNKTLADLRNLSPPIDPLKNMQLSKEDYSAIIIQRNWNGFKARKYYDNLKRQKQIKIIY